MNTVTREIAALLGITFEYARKVQDAMEIDLAKCTHKEFNTVARRTYADMIHKEEVKQ